MASDLYVQPEFCGEITSNEVIGFDLNLSSMSCLPYPSLSALEDDSANWVIPFVDKTRNHKRLKQEHDANYGFKVGTNYHSFYTGSDSNMCTSSFTSLPTIRFRDHISAHKRRYLAAEAMEEAFATLMRDKEDESEEGGGSEDEIKLVQQLIACAEAVACRDKAHASALLFELRANAQAFGTSFQRVSSCFVQGLADRLALVQPLGAGGVIDPNVKSKPFSAEKDEALHLVYEICPQIQFGHFVANASILEAFEGGSSVHVIDLGMTLGLQHGYQWRDLIDRLANRPGQPLHRLRITGVGRSSERLQAIGDDLKLHAQSMKINLDFSEVESNLENLKPQDFHLVDGEILIINSILQLHCLVKESRGTLNSALQTLHELSPKLMVLVEQDASHNGPFFLGRFMEALHNYSAIFDSLDAMLPKYDTRRVKMEQFYFGEEIKNIVSCEGPARVERHERVDQWRRRMRRAGFQPAPLRTMAQAVKWLETNACEGFTVVEDKGCLVLGWKSKPIIATSCWK
ncbi:unnamed protein product [Malus baccata var. baccata]